MSTEEERKLAAVTMMLTIMQAMMWYQWYGRNKRRVIVPRALIRNWDAQRNIVFTRMFRCSDRICYEQLRMRIFTFERLCTRLRGYGLVDSRSVKIEEQVAIFLHTVGHDLRNRTFELQFFRSTETINRYFHRVLNALLRLHRDEVRPATIENSPADCGGTPKSWHHFFQDAVGAIDGTHFEAYVPPQDQVRYRNRKGQVTQNVLVACTFGMRFTYVLTGWEGSAHDGRLLRCAVSRPGHKLTVPHGKYYLADAGFPLVPHFLTPYRAVRYHLSDQQRNSRYNGAQNAKEMYNFRHSSLRNVVERTIGVLKKRFAYLRHAPHHDVETQAKIICACCGLHNFLLDNNDDIWEEERATIEEEGNGEVGDDVGITMTPSDGWTAWRDGLMADMWERRDERNGEE